MLSSPSDQLPPDRGWSFEAWRGGVRVLAFVTPDQVRILDENGRDVTTSHEAVAAELASLSRRAKRPFVAEGELFTGGGEPSFHATDLLVDGETVLRERKYKVRREALQKLFHRRRLSRIALQQVETSGETMMRRAKRRGWAGVIARRKSGLYTPGQATEDVRRVPIS
jgi:bifunctional non-homologous end joining protein LigD